MIRCEREKLGWLGYFILESLGSIGEHKWFGWHRKLVCAKFVFGSLPPLAEVVGSLLCEGTERHVLKLSLKKLIKIKQA